MARWQWTSAVLALALVAAWTWPASRNMMLGRFESTIGAAYALGVGLKREPAEAVRWYRRAAERGSASAQFNLGYALQHGEGVAIDEAGAASWYARSAAQGNAQAANNLAAMYANPSTGPANLVLARVWLKRALPLADRELADTIRDNIASLEAGMTAEELAASDHPDAVPATAAAVADLPPEAPKVAADPDAPPARKVQFALRSAEPMRQAVIRFYARNQRLPVVQDALAAAGLRPLETPYADVALGVGGMVSISIRGGELDGRHMELIPTIAAGKLRWSCIKDEVPARYFTQACT